MTRNHATMVIPSPFKYSDLRSIIYEVTEITSSEFDITMRVKYKLDWECPG